MKIWRTITAGYPYRTPSQLGVANYLDAFVATKHAVYCMLYNRDVDVFYRGSDERGDNIVAAMKVMVNERKKWNKNSNISKFDIYKSRRFY